MLFSAVPARFTIPFANAAAGPFIRDVPTASQIGVQDGAASLTDGFVPDNFTALAGGGVPPFGQDMNGILKRITQWNQWQAAGGPITFDAVFAAAIGGYPRLAQLCSTVVWGTVWVSLADGNTTDPDNPLTAANWMQLGIPTGTPVGFWSSTLPPGYVVCNTLTIGNAVSNATGLAGPSTYFLYRHNWLNFSNTLCPIFTSAGAPSTRGANPDADFAANKALAMPDMRGRGLIGVDTMGAAPTTFLVGVPILGTRTVPGSIVGENFHVLLTQENGPHGHGNSLTDLGHVHGNGLIDPGHAHGNSLTDPQHAHANSLTDPQHIHGQTLLGGTEGLALAGGAEGWASGGRSHIAINNGFSINPASTGISINNASAATGISINNAATVTGMSISNASATTGIVINNAPSGSGTPHNTVHLSATVYWGQRL